MMDVGLIRGVLRLEDQFSSTLKAAANQLTASTQKLQAAAEQAAKLGQSLVPLSAAAGAAAAAAFKLGKDFEASMTRVITLVGVAEGRVKDFERGILELAGQTAKAPRELAEALFVITSAGIRGAEAMRILEASAKASAAGLGVTKEIARAVTAAVQAYGAENLSAAQATDIMFATVREGNLSAEELAPTLGRVIGIASQVGVTFDQVGAFIATFTRLGVDSAEAVTALRGVLATILRPTKDAREAMAQAGTSIDELRAAIKERGLTAALNELVERFRGNEDELARVVPNIRALSGIMGTAGAQAAVFAQIQRSLAESAGLVAAGFARASQDLEFSWEQLWVRMQIVAVRVFGVFRREFERSSAQINLLVGYIEQLAARFEQLGPAGHRAVAALVAIAAAVSPLLLAVGTLGVVAAPLARGFGLLGSAVSALVSPVGVLVAAIGGLATALAMAGASQDRVMRSLAFLGGPLTSLGVVVREVRAGWEQLARVWESLRTSSVAGALEAVARILDAGVRVAVAVVRDQWGGLVTLWRATTAALADVAQWLGDVAARLAGLGRRLTEALPVVRDLALVVDLVQRLNLSDLASQAEAGAAAIERSTGAVGQAVSPLSRLIPEAAKAGQAVGGLVAPLQGVGAEAGVVAGVLHAALIPGFDGSAQRAGALSEAMVALRNSVSGAAAAQDIADLIAVWNSLTASQRSNNEIIERVLQAYVELRDDAVGPLRNELERLLDQWFAFDDAVARHQQLVSDLASQFTDFGEWINRGIIEPGKALTDQQRELTQELGEWLFVTPRLIQHIVDANERAAAATIENIQDVREWGLELGWLADAFEQLAQVADGALSRVVRIIGTVIAAMQLARQSGLELKQALASGDWKSAVGAAVGGASGVIQATSQGNTVTRAVSGAATGAQIGAAFGPVGMGVGAAVGGLVGVFRGLFGPSEGRKRLLEANKQIEDLRQSLLRTYGTLDDIRKLGGALGVDLAGLWGSQNVQGLRDFTMAAEEFARKLEAVRAEMQRIAETGEVASTDLVRFRDAMRDTPEVRDFIRRQVEIIGESVKVFLDNAKIATQGGADAIAQMLLLAWDGTTKGLAALMPAIEQYRQQLEAAGLQSSRAFGFFREMAALAADEVRGPLLQGINAGTDALVAMFNAGLLTQDTFGGMVGEIMAQRQALLDSGAAADVVNAAMQKDLQRIWELTHLHGLQVDETTQALLDEAEASGLIGKQFVNATDRMVAGIERLVELFEAAFGDRLPNAVRDGAQQAVAELYRVLPEEIPIRVRYTVEGDGGDGPSRQHGSPGTAFERWGSGTLAMLHGDEAVVTRRQGESLAAMLEHAVARATSWPSGEIVIPIRLDADGVRLAEVVARHHPRAVGLRGG